MEIEGYEIDDLFDSEDLESIENKIDFAFGHTQEEIARIFKCTQPRICQILANIYKTALETA